MGACHNALPTLSLGHKLHPSGAVKQVHSERQAQRGVIPCDSFSQRSSVVVAVAQLVHPCESITLAVVAFFV